MKTFMHAANNISKLNNYKYDGFEIDFQLCDNQFINSHHFYFGSPFVKNNWINKLKQKDFINYQKNGECLDIDIILSNIKSNKIVIIDLKNWILKIPGILFNKGNSYLYNQKLYANLFCEKIKKYKNYENIMIQSYDHKLIIEIIKELNKQKIKHKFKFGLIIRTNFQINSAENYINKYPISFLAIRYKALKKMEDVLKEYNNIKIYGWFDIDDFLISENKKIKLIKQANCYGYIK